MKETNNRNIDEAVKGGIMKNTFKVLIEFTVVVIAVLLIIHRRVIAAVVTGSKMPEMPEWHKKFFH